MEDYRMWRHIFKLDPNKKITDENLEQICESGTDAVIVGGTDGVTLDDVLDLLARIRRYTVPCIMEVSNLESITPGFDFYFIPMVLNSTDKKWMLDLHHQAVKEYGDFIEWEELMAEGYIMLNPDSKAYQQTDAKATTEEDVIAYAQVAEHLFNLPFVYLEYSGTYGDPALVEKVNQTLDQSMLIYGGGIESKEQAKEMAERSDIVVVGDVIYEDINKALRTVHAVKVQASRDANSNEGGL
ncbi:heptaprenylglyceryl phosphate synthase [Halalkalibacillus sediminis]|uniref:Heptaprenylglyceryl phosphate synthase n=1 Tax=Halalkalibacillus sediminis TaxID=2018042 RepID=A0A2I0QRM5_9BACI|nr:heptaprenylglyceryl phosphate synthase [Halalkalibacillus sediminis]PKR76981.1 heptaprenylglyceryl phosphate synthase [Halalkalibacillus sediminis]